MSDINPDQLIAAKDNIAKNLEFLVAKGIFRKDDVARFQELVTYTTSVEEAVKDVQFIQESGRKNMKLSSKC